MKNWSTQDHNFVEALIISKNRGPKQGHVFVYMYNFLIHLNISPVYQISRVQLRKV